MFSGTSATGLGGYGAAGAGSAPSWRTASRQVATDLLPSVAKLREEFEATEALAVGMSGSGPTVYGVFANRDAAERGAEALQRGARGTWVARTIGSG